VKFKEDRNYLQKDCESMVRTQLPNKMVKLSLCVTKYNTIKTCPVLN